MYGMDKRKIMSEITRMESTERFNNIVIHNNVVYLAGVVSKDKTLDVKVQTRDILNSIDKLLVQAGTDKSKILTAQIWLKDIDNDFAGMNEAWSEWLDKENMPTRATCEAKLAAPEVLIEIIVTAAL